MIVRNFATFLLEILEARESIIKKALQLTEETDENMHPEKMQLQKSNGVTFSLSRDSLETNGENGECSGFMLVRSKAKLLLQTISCILLQVGILHFSLKHLMKTL